MRKSPLIILLFLLAFLLTSCGDFCDESCDEICYEYENLPSDVADMANFYGKKYNIDPTIFLVIAWHERASVYGWYDDYVFGYGAYDTKPWPEKYAGWETQWKHAAPKIGKFFSKNEPSVESFQRFARDIYKTTAWQSYRTCYQYYLEMTADEDETTES